MTRATVTIKTPEDRNRIAIWARNVDDGTVVTFRKKSRSTEQNSKLHAMLGEVSRQVEWHGQYLDLEDWKDMFTASLRHARVVPGIDRGTYVPLGMHTSTLTIEEMSNLIELIYAFGADPDHPVVFKEPKSTESGSPPQEPGNAESEPSSASAASDDAVPSKSSDAPPTERDTLIKFAKDMLPMAADTSVSPAVLKSVEREWAPLIKELSPDNVEKARAISESVRAIANDPKRLGPALQHFAEVLETTVEGLRGDEDGQ